MEEVDDFGDLYADVQIPATSSFNPSSDFAHLYNTQRTHSPLKKNADSSCERPSRSGQAFEDRKVSSEESHLPSASDSDASDEDDLQIVLNNDCNVPATVVSVNEGLDADEENGDFDGYDDAGEFQRTNNWSDPDDGVLSPNGVKTDYLSGHLHYKHSHLHRMSSKVNGLSASVEGEDCLLGRSASAAQNCLAFSLPWYRTIFDVNIGTFENKPWTLPRADASNYFNFGFDEESWKHYCNQLDNFRRLKSRLSDHSSRLKGYEVGASAHGEQLIEASSAFLKESQGRVIQVGDCSIERLPSIDTKWSTDRDSEAIQIVLKDFVEDSSSKTSLTEKDTVMDVLGSKQHKDVDWHHDENPNLTNSKGRAEPTQISEDSMDKDDKDSCKTVLSMEGMGSLLQEPSLSSPSPSSSGTHCALSNDTTYNKKVKSRLNKEKSVDFEYYDRKRSRISPVSMNLEHYSKEGDRSSERKNSSAYDAEVICNLYHSKAGNTRQDNTRVYRTNCYDKEDAIHHERYAHINSNEKTFDWQKNHLASSRRSYRDEEELLLLRRWNEKQYLPTKNLSNHIGGFIENPPKRKEYRKLFPNEPPYMDNESSFRRKNGDRFQFREATTEDDERCGIYDKKRKFLDGKYENPYMSIGNASFDESDYRRYSSNRRPHPYSDWDNLDYMPSRSNRSRESVQYRHLYEDFPGERRLNYPDIDSYSERRMSLHWPENVCDPRWRDNDFLSEEALFSAERNSKHVKVGRQWKLVGDRVEGWQSKFNKQIGEENSGYHLPRNPGTSHRRHDDDDNHKEIPSKCVDLPFIDVRGKVKFDETKSCRRCCGSGHMNLLNNCYEKKRVHGGQSGSLSKKAAIQRDWSDVNNMNWLDKYPVTENNIECSSDVEEGEIVTEDQLLEETKPRNQPMDEQQIVEVRAKMIKRRERFMEEPVMVNKKNEVKLKHIVSGRAEFVDTTESGVGVAEPNKQERPIRKRRWGGN